MVLFLVLTLTALCTACLYAIYAICLSHFASPYRHLPRPKQPHLFRRFLHEPTTFELTKWVRTVPNDGLIRYFGLLNQERLLLTTIEGYKELLLRDARKYDKLPALAALQWPIGVSGLVSAKGILHKVHRRRTIAAYNASWARTLHPEVWQQAQKAVIFLAAHAVGPGEHVLVVNQFLRRVCLDTIGHVAFRLDLGAVRDPERDTNRRYLHAFDEADKGSPLFLKLLQVCPDPLKMLASTIVSRIILRIDTSGMNSLIRKSVAAKLRALGDGESGSNKRPYSTSDAGPKLDLMDAICLRAKYHLSERALCRHAQTILAGSVEMVSNQLAWAIYALSLPANQHVQDKVRDEIRHHFPSYPETLTGDNIRPLAYLHGVVDEILRLFPSVSHRGRICNNPTTLLKQQIRKGTLVVWPINAMNRNPVLWGLDADELRPERWLDGNSARRDGYAFMTFGQGSRKCPGEHYTRVVIACMLLSMLSRFRFTLPPSGDILAGDRRTVGFGLVMKAQIAVRVQAVAGWGEGKG